MNYLKSFQYSSELQVILLKTIYAISYRLEEQIELPENLRYVAHKALSEEDIDFRGAGLVALGNIYYFQDIPFLVGEAIRKLPDTQQLILTNLLSYSSPEVVKEFFGLYCSMCNRNMEHSDFLSLILLYGKMPVKRTDWLPLKRTLNWFYPPIQVIQRRFLSFYWELIQKQ